MNYDPQQVTPQSVAGGTIASGGSGYKVGDIPGPADGALVDGSLAASFYVKSVDSNGAITAVVLLEGGYYIVLPSTPSSVTGGSGTGAVLNLTFTTPSTLSWQVPAASDLQTVLTGIVTNTADESLVGGNRSTLAISGAVARVRGAIRKGRKTPLSQTAGSVPPEAFIHTLVLAVNILVGAKPTLIQSVIGPNGGVYTPFYNMRDEAKKWLEDTAAGRPTDPPSDPDPGFQSATYVGGNSEYNDLTTFGAPSPADFPTEVLGTP